MTQADPAEGDTNPPEVPATNTPLTEAMAAATAAGGAEQPVDEQIVDAAPIDPLAAVTAERDEYLDALQRLKAEFANHRRRTDEQAGEIRKQAAAGLVEKLVPILDACEAALGQGAEEVRPISDALHETLNREGLSLLNPVGEPFDPELHEAVLHEEGDGGEQVVAEVLRSGYAWNGRVVRAAMVKVRG